MRVRDEEDDDARDVLALIEAAFGRPSVAQLWRELRAEGLVRAALVAELDGKVVGHVETSAAWLDARQRLVDIWVLSPLSVPPDHQGRGVGTALVAAVLERARAAEAPMVVLEGAPSYYGPRGFERGADHRLYPPSARTPDRAFLVALTPAYEPWMTGQCIYRDVWWRHDTAGLRGEHLEAAEQMHGVADPRPR